MTKLKDILNGEPINEDSNLSKIKDYIKRNQFNIDYSSLFELYRTVFFGESHNLVSPKKDFIKGIPEMAETGVTHIALEGFPASMQGALDRFYKVGDNKNKLYQYIHKETILNDKCVDKYIELLETARKHKIRLIALDLDKDVKIKQSMKLDGFPLLNLLSLDMYNSRNKQWGEIISKVLESEKNSKIAVYCGSAHCGYDTLNQRANNYLKNFGYDSLSVPYAGGKKFDKDLNFLFEHRIAKAAVQLGLKNKRFAILIDKSTLRNGDLYIHLPQVEKRFP